MQHLDDGLLAAYLDGEGADSRTGGQAVEAHVTECGGCRARLDVMRATRDRARAILRSAAPGGAQPSFQDVLNRRQAAKAGARSLARLRPMAWAATVVLALGVGWYARELRLSAELDSIGKLADAPLEADPSPAARTVVTAAPQEPPAATATGAGTLASRARELESGPVTRRNRSEATSTPAAAPTATTPVPPALRGPDTSVKLAAPLTADDARLAAKAKDSQPIALAQAEMKKEMANVAVMDAPSGRAAARAPAPAPAAARDETRGFEARDGALAAATRILGRPPLTAPGLEVLGYDVGESPGIVRVRQRMGTGVLEIHQQRAGTPEVSGPSASRAVTGPGVGGLVEGIQVRLWGSVSYDSLRALVGKLR